MSLISFLLEIYLSLNLSLSPLWNFVLFFEGFFFLSLSIFSQLSQGPAFYFWLSFFLSLCLYRSLFLFLFLFLSPLVNLLSLYLFLSNTSLTLSPSIFRSLFHIPLFLNLCLPLYLTLLRALPFSFSFPLH